jgi:hypothetical protein
MAEKRLYFVQDSAPAVSERLVLATSGSAAIKHVVADSYTATPAKPLEVASFFLNGGEMEEAGAEEAEVPATA